MDKTSRQSIAWLNAGLFAAVGAVAALSIGSVDARPRGSDSATGSIGVTRDRGMKKIDAPGSLAEGTGVTSMSKQQKQALLDAIELASAPGTTYAKVNAGSPSAPHRMALVGVGVKTFNPMVPMLELPRKKGQDAFAGLWIRSMKKGAKYLIECEVTRTSMPQDLQGTPRYFVRAGGVGVLQTHLSGKGHLAWVLDSPDAEWHDYRIHSPDVDWALLGCEATNL